MLIQPFLTSWWDNNPKWLNDHERMVEITSQMIDFVIPFVSCYGPKSMTIDHQA